MAEEFLKKVYDKYLGSDYEFGDSDLNPKREISKSGLEALEDEEEAILAKISERIKKLHEMSSTLPKYKVPEKVENDNFTTESTGAALGSDPSPSVNENTVQIKLNMGGDTSDKHLLLPSGGTNTQVDFLLSELEQIMIPVLTIINAPDFPGRFPGPGSIVPLMDPACDEYDNDRDSEYESENKDLLALKKDGEESSSGSGDSDEEDSSISTKDAAEAADDAATENENLAAQQVAERNREVAECIAKEVPILSSILAMLKIVNVIKKVLMLILTIVVPIVKMIAFAAQCWINPPAAAQVIQMVAEKIAALLITALGEILQMLWNMLELDCKTEQTQKILDEINEVLSGVSSALRSTKSSAISFSKQMKSMGETFKNLPEQMQKGAENWTKEFQALGEEDTWNQGNEALTRSLFGMADPSKNPGDATNNLLQKSLPFGIKDKLNKALNSTKNIIKNTKQVIQNADMSKDQKTAGVQQTLNKLVETLGPIKIK